MLGAATVLAQGSNEDAVAAYHRGEFDTARRIWTGLAESGNVQAQYSLGVLYSRGEGVEQSAAEATAWFRRAAAQDHADSQFNLGVAHWTGNGAEQSAEQAVNWWRKAAVGGLAVAQYNLGAAYLAGSGVEPELGRALFWLSRSAEQSYQEAEASLEIIRKRAPRWFKTIQAPKAARFAYLNKAATLNPEAGAGGSLDTLLGGVPVWILSDRPGYAEVRVPGGVPVWVHGDYVEGEGLDARITGSSVRIRSRPSTGDDSVVLGRFSSGERVVLLDTEGDWHRVLAPETVTAWVAESVITRVESLPRLWYVEWAAHRDLQYRRFGLQVDIPDFTGQ